MLKINQGGKAAFAAWASVETVESMAAKEVPSPKEASSGREMWVS